MANKRKFYSTYTHEFIALPPAKKLQEASPPQNPRTAELYTKARADDRLKAETIHALMKTKRDNQLPDNRGQSLSSLL